MSALQRNVLLLEVSTLHGPELHLDVSALQRSLLLLEVSATGPELHLDVSALQRNVLLMVVSATGPELNLDVSALRRYVSNPQGPVRVKRVRFASKIICLLWNVFASLRK